MFFLHLLIVDTTTFSLKTLNMPRGSRDIKSCISGSDALKLLELTRECLSCCREMDFKQFFPRLQELFPFDHAIAFLGRHELGKGVVPAHTVNFSLPEEWHTEFRSRGYLYMDAIVRNNFAYYRSQFWSDTDKRPKKKKEIMSLCEDFSMRNGYTHGSKPVYPDDNGSMFCFSGLSMRFDERVVALLDYVVPHLHLALTNTFKKKTMDNKNILLSTREKDILNWLKHGKSSWEMSVILDISESTVNFHVYNILRKLDVSKRSQAVAVAAHLGLIDLC
jgi:LuxR family transcriptional regulator, quorum-sensing system regulator CviR